MSVSFKLRTTRTDGDGYLTARIQAEKLGVNILVKTPIKVDIAKFTASPNGKVFPAYMSSPEGQKIQRSKLEIESAINSLTDSGKKITSEEAKKIIEDIYYKDEREAAAAKEAERQKQEAAANRMTLSKFINKYIEDVESGARQTEQGRNYAKGTVKAIKQALVQFRAFETSTKRTLDFDDIDMCFYQEYTAWLRGKNYAINSIGKCIKELKAIMFTAQSEGYHNNNLWRDRKFKGTRVEVDNIYLTKEDLEKMQKVDMSKLSAGHQLALDIFMVGVWTAQRVSDYNNINKEDFEKYNVRYIVDEPDPDNPGKVRSRIEEKETMIVNIRQQKTGAKVAIPCSPELIKIVEKYKYQMPHMVDSLINRYIKDVAKEAGLTELVDIQTTNGGNIKTEQFPKYKLIHTHTARRTGATLMYLSGMDVYDIMKITGHSSPLMLRKYIKADELDVIDKIMNKYNYFK